MDKLVVDMDLLRRYDKTGPRYTSYPTAVQFSDDFGEADYRQAATHSNRDPDKTLSLYYHIPFCATLCFYCACNKIVTKKKEKAVEYLEHLFTEIELQGELYDCNRSVIQLHLGGGTPTFLSMAQIGELLALTGRHFSLSSGDERDYSIEIDPRTVDVDMVSELYDLGFNRLSLGVQDFDPNVQRAVHRIQPEHETLEIIDASRKAGFESINVDLIYGLPLQNPNGFAHTLDTIITASPDRLSIFNYAHLPQMFAPQRRIREADLPSPEAKLDMLSRTVEQLTEAGYVYIGMDHFARPDDVLVKARDEHTLYRNFQGYASHADCDLVGMGVTSISKVANCYSQHAKTLEEYYALVSERKLPVNRGISLDVEDRMRREIIESLMCYGEIDYSLVEQRYGVDFENHFSGELAALDIMQSDGLLQRKSNGIAVLPPGRFLIRNISMVFDAYLQAKTETPRFSRLI